MATHDGHGLPGGQRISQPTGARLWHVGAVLPQALAQQARSPGAQPAAQT